MSEQEGRASDELARYLLELEVLTPEWAKVFRAVPRSLFLPDLFWAYDLTTGRSEPVDRREDPVGWEEAAYRDIPLVTQWDDGQHTGAEPGSAGTSSASMPSVVASMLCDLDVSDGMRVLEVGTGTGWNAGLLAHRLGGANVVSVEIDPAVAARASDALTRAGLTPLVVEGDGRDGWAAGAPYDRVIATAGVRALPPRWLEQTRPGGTILAPWGTHYSNQDALVRLTVGEDGRAVGPFLRMVEFMKLRDQRLDWNLFRGHVKEFPGDADVSRTSVPLADLGDRYETPYFVTGLCVPDCAHVVNESDSGEAGDAKAWFFDFRSQSWAAVVFTPGAADATVYQSGARRLWDEVERALTWWIDRGRPEYDRFGLTVDRDGSTRAWLDDPSDILPFAEP
ncbi:MULTISPECIES: methyltransferase domain-containing protein [unclassified Streptomyces]|uniref:methyltransferase domain-containing protein n=1 Tax=unclassified Streptomyces TaxID=2593676 RepID=UPI00081DE4FE|nr:MULTISPECIES: methyltransferase domain-containing protein [unclassified Streptomyces]MYZ35447.1 methyltransferase domain-containing protein [Streptomyces sp. SID4917]SCF75532.1 Protein-L-isoaspartate O-methyltransferase [Streptomyces sp. MnatMP-M17]